MYPIKSRYLELLSLTQLFLLREYPLNQAVAIGTAHFSLFQEKKRNLSPLNSPKKGDITLAPLSSAQPMKKIEELPPSLSLAEAITQPPIPQIKAQPTPAQRVAQPQKAPLVPKQNQEAKANNSTKQFTLEPLSTPSHPIDLHEFKKLFQNLYSDMHLLDSTPSDAMAVKIKNRWLIEKEIPSVVILSFFKEPRKANEEKQLALLKNISQAITLHYAPARVFNAFLLEKEKKWETLLTSPNLKLVIASDYGFYSQPGLMHFYRELPQERKHFLHNTPLMLLSDLSLYLKEPRLKAHLWRAISNEFSPLKNLPPVP